jgi:hypothetical protein
LAYLSRNARFWRKADIADELGAGEEGRVLSLSDHFTLAAHALLNVFPRTKNRFLRAYFREYEFGYCANPTQLAHIQMGHYPIGAIKCRIGQ